MASGEQLAQVAGFGEMKHCSDHDGGKRRMRHPLEQGSQQNEGEERKKCCNDVGELGAGASGHGDGGLGQTADGKEAAEKAAQDISGSVREKFLIWINIAPALRRSCLRRAQRL